MKTSFRYFCLLMGLMFSLQLSYSQDLKVEEIIPSLSELYANPDNYNSEYRKKIFDVEAAKYFMTNIDSSYMVYNQMIAFSKEQNDVNLQGKAYVAISELKGMRGDYKSAKSTFQKALFLFDNDPNSQSSAMSGLANTYLKLNNLDSAELVIDKCIKLTFEKCDTFTFASPLIMKANILSLQKKYYSALDQYYHALKYGKSHYNSLKLCDLYRNIGNLYQKIGDLENAISFASIGLDLAEKNNYERSTSKFNIQIGTYYRQMNNFKLSLVYLNKALPYQEEYVSPKSLFKLYSNLAITHLKLEDIPMADTYINKATTLYPSIYNINDKILFKKAQAQRAGLHRDYKKSIASFQELIKMGKESNTSQLMIYGYEGITEMNKKNGKWKNAFLYSDSLKMATAALDLDNQKNLIYDLDARYNTKLKEAEIKQLTSDKALQDLQLKKKQRQFLIVIGGLLLSLVAFFGFYNAYRIKHKSNELLKIKNKELSTALSTNKILVKEIHHRVKNNLQVVSSLLNLQSRFEKNTTVLEAINKGKNRVQTMSLLHQNLYANENLKSINIKKYFTELAENLTDGYPLNGREVNLITDIEDIQLDIDQVVPLGLITNELITNALKYAFQNNKINCELILSIKQYGEQLEMIVSDNGGGLPFTEIPSRSTSMGMMLIQSFSNKLKASLKINNENGTKVSLKFNIR